MTNNQIAAEPQGAEALAGQAAAAAADMVRAVAARVAETVQREVAETVAAAPVIRRATIEDVPALLAIYNYEIVNGIATLDVTPKTLEEWTGWFDAHQTDLHPIFVVECDGKVAGYTSFSPYRRKEAYRSTVELSVYVDPAMRGRGLAKCLLGAIIEHARQHEEIHLIVSVIVDGNAASMRLHERYGFAKCGVVHEVGFKKGRYHDILTYELFV